MNKEIRKVVAHLRLRNYSPRTVRNYTHCLRRYFTFLADFRLEPIWQINETAIQDFLIGLQNRGYAPQTTNLHLNAIKFYYHQVLRSHRRISIKMAKRAKKLPVVLSKSEVLRIIESIQNPKHQLLIQLAYSSGLRVGEVIRLRIKDIDLSYYCLTVRQGKGRKDRVTIFSEKLIDNLRFYMSYRRPLDYLFPSEHGGRLSERTAQKVFKKALCKSEIQKEASFHSLRHSFATHLLENGTDIRYIQEMLGHVNIRTTEIYTSVATHQIRKIKSPL